MSGFLIRRKMNDFLVNVDINSASGIVHNEIVGGSVTGVLVDRYTVHVDNLRAVTTLVYEKHYWRAENRLTLTITLDNCNGMTRVHTCSAGGGKGLFRFDWGASGNFEDAVRRALSPYIVQNVY